MYDHQSPIQERAIGQTGLHRKAPHGLFPSFISAVKLRVSRSNERRCVARSGAPTHLIVLRIDKPVPVYY